ncbi:hypothetical protein BH23GEM2_BH23GEM2_21290 [soil metagenome]
MHVAITFFEDYWLFLAELMRQLQRVEPRASFSGLAARRATVCPMIEALRAEGVRITEYEWLGTLERQWVDGPFDMRQLGEYRERYGDETLKRLLICDRELAFGFISGGRYATTPLRQLVERRPEKRWQYVCNALRFYENRFASRRPDVVINAELTMTFEVAAYYVAKQQGIPSYSFSPSRFGDRLLMVDNPQNRTPVIDRLGGEAVRQRSLIDEDSWTEAAAYVGRFRMSPCAPAYSRYQLEQAVRSSSLRGFVGDAARAVAKGVAGALGMKGTRGFLRRRGTRDLLGEAVRRFRVTRQALAGEGFADPDAYLRDPYLYFPLQVDPEASMMVCAPYRTNQLALIEDLAKAMPAGFKLLVKDHAPMLGGRPDGFYDRIRGMPDVVLVDPFADNYGLIASAALVVTVTGTVGWESIALRKPVLVLGECQYIGFTQGFRVYTGCNDLRTEIMAAIAEPSADDEALIAYVAATYAKSFAVPARAFGSAHYGTDGPREIARCLPELQRLAAAIVQRSAA